MKDYRIVGKYGQWGEILPDLESAQEDLDFCTETYAGRDEFRIQERDVTEWKEVASRDTVGTDG